MKHKWLRVAGLSALAFVCGFVIYRLLISGVDFVSPAELFATLMWWFFRGESGEFMQAASSCSRFLIFVCSAPFVLFGILPALIWTLLQAPDDRVREKDRPE